MTDKKAKAKKNNLIIVTVLVVCLIVIIGIIATANNQNKRSHSDKITIVATLFPQYDFARQIAGEYAEVTLLLPPGMESHSFDLRPSDMITIKNSDMFIYTGKYMETWAGTIIESLDDTVKVVDVSQGIELVKGNDYGIGEHDHDHDDDDDYDHNHGHSHEYDPHIWTSPVNAIIMVENVLEALCEVDPEHSDYYTANASAYITKLQEVDAAFRELSDSLEDRCIFFGGRFAMTYFAREYGFDCIAAYHDCSAESEPSIAQVMLLIDEIREHNAGAIYYEELVDPKVARTIAEETGVKLLLLHSAHNLSRSEFESGMTYLDIMWSDYNALKEGLDGTAKLQ